MFDRKAHDDEYRAQNQAACTARSKAWYHANKDRVLHKRYEREYGCTWEDKVDMFEWQGGECAICHDELGSVAKAHLDHNHTTGEIRALLCRGCNHLLSNAKENKAILQSAIEYLENFNAQ